MGHLDPTTNQSIFFHQASRYCSFPRIPKSSSQACSQQLTFNTGMTQLAGADCAALTSGLVYASAMVLPSVRPVFMSVFCRRCDAPYGVPALYVQRMRRFRDWSNTSHTHPLPNMDAAVAMSSVFSASASVKVESMYWVKLGGIPIGVLLGDWQLHGQRETP